MYSELQKNAIKITFCPINQNLIAICGQDGAIIYSTKMSKKNKIKYKPETEIHESFTTLNFSHDGKFIAFGSCYSAYISIYNVITTKMHKVAKINSPIREILWSPQDHYLLVNTPSSQIRIFEIQKFENDQWNKFSNPISNIFAINSENFIFAVIENTSLIYCFAKMDINEISIKNQYNVPFLLTNTIFDFSFEKSWTIKNTVISPNSTRLAIIFINENLQKTALCLFKIETKIGFIPNFIPMYFLRKK